MNVLVLLASLSLLQTPARDKTPKDLEIDAPTRAAVIEAALKELDQNYVFPDVAKKMGEVVRARANAKGYDALSSARQFAAELTKDLQSVSHDKHLRVRFEVEPRPPRPAPPADAQEQRGPSPEELAEFRRDAAKDNFGFVKVERLEGNVGYIDFRQFFPAAVAGEKASAAMAFVADTDALIFDLRHNGGGAPDQVAWLCSYLFDGRVHLNDIYERPSDSTEQFWTSPSVPGAKYVGKPVYVLTSAYTFSGAEEFAYNLQTQERATIVGETTGGGANPGGMARLHERFSMFVPQGRAINPITKTNWEGVGVKPDVAVAAEQALAKAHVLALEGLLAERPNEMPVMRREALEARTKELASAPAALPASAKSR